MDLLPTDHTELPTDHLWESGGWWPPPTLPQVICGQLCVICGQQIHLLNLRAAASALRVKSLVNLIPRILQMGPRLPVRGPRQRGPDRRVERRKLASEERPDVAGGPGGADQLQELGRDSRWWRERRGSDLVSRRRQIAPLELPAVGIYGDARGAELTPDAAAHVGEHFSQAVRLPRIG